MQKIPKRWRELSIATKLEIPNKYFNIDKETLIRIRNISNPTKRLIEAAKIQYELFGDIHSYLTSWIAGYSSDVVVRNYFGSTRVLLEMFMKLPEKSPEFSWADVKRNIKIPQDMNEDLAKETGIHIGDGNLYINISKDNSKSYQYCISGDLRDEFIFHSEYISKLMKRIYNINTLFMKRKNKNNIDSRYKSKAIVLFKNNILKLPIGSKKNIKIPEQIRGNPDFMKKCISGIIDTDFSVTDSFGITGKLNNLFVAKEMHRFFDKEGIKHVYRLYYNYARFYISKYSALKILNEWKIDNMKHISKYLVFNEFKKYIPFTTTSERLALLWGKINLEDLEKISRKRRENTTSAGLEPATP